MHHPYDKAVPGRPHKMTAAELNGMKDAALAFRRSQNDQATPPQVYRTPGVVGLVRNNSGADWPRFAAVALRGPIILPADNLAEFQRQPALEGYTAEAADVAQEPQRVAVTLTPIPDGEIGDVQLAGVTPCQVSGAGDFAQLTEAETYLTAGASGPAEILWSEAGTGTRWAWVRLAQNPLIEHYISVDGTSPGTGDSAVAAFQVMTLRVYLGSGLGIANPSTGVGEISLQPASHTHAGGADLTDGQWLGANTKLVDKVQVGVGSLQAWPLSYARAYVKGAMHLEGDFASSPVELPTVTLHATGLGADGVSRLRLDGEGRATWFAGGPLGVAGNGVYAELRTSQLNIDGTGAYAGIASYGCCGTPAVANGTYKTVTTTGGIVTGGSTTNGGATGTVP